MILLIGYSVANIFFWNRPLLLAQGFASYPFWVSFWTMLAKVALILVLLPRTGYLAEAALLSGFFVISVGLNVWRGLREVNRAEGASRFESQRLGHGLDG